MGDGFPVDRRTVVKLAAGASVAPLSAVAGCGGVGFTINPASGAAADTQFTLGARTGGWHGIAPDQIRGERNPILRMPPGATIELTWENLDGKPHRFVIEDSLGHPLVESSGSSARGVTRTVSFEATQQMTTYLDPRYPVYMRGELLVSD